MIGPRRAGTVWTGLLSATLLWACGGTDDPMSSAPPQTPNDGSVAGAASMDDAPQELNGCAADAYEEHSGESDERVIQIAANGLSFTPQCLLIAAGQAVRFEGSLSSHPLAPGKPEDPSAGSPDSPIAETSSGMSVEFTFDSAGTFPYFCQLHAFGNGMGMAGAVLVR